MGLWIIFMRDILKGLWLIFLKILALFAFTLFNLLLMIAWRDYVRIILLIIADIIGLIIFMNDRLIWNIFTFFIENFNSFSFSNFFLFIIIMLTFLLVWFFIHKTLVWYTMSALRIVSLQREFCNADIWLLWGFLCKFIQRNEIM
jgi:hypothetical protein